MGKVVTRKRSLMPLVGYGAGGSANSYTIFWGDTGRETWEKGPGLGNYSVTGVSDRSSDDDFHFERVLKAQVRSTQPAFAAGGVSIVDEILGHTETEVRAALRGKVRVRHTHK